MKRRNDRKTCTNCFHARKSRTEKPCNVCRYSSQWEDPNKPIEVVRCRDCKWYWLGDIFSDTYFCFRLRDSEGDRVGYNFADDDYCSYGERPVEVDL